MIRIQEFIRRVGIKSQEELAERLGVTNVTVSNWANGSRTPTFAVCRKLYELGITTEELFGKAYPSSATSADTEFDRRAAHFMKKLLDNMDKI